MKINVDELKHKREALMHWLFFAVISSRKDGTDIIMNQTGYDPQNIDFKIVIDGVEFDDLAPIFKRLQKHLDSMYESANEMAVYRNQIKQFVQTVNEHAVEVGAVTNEDLIDFGVVPDNGH